MHNTLDINSLNLHEIQLNAIQYETKLRYIVQVHSVVMFQTRPLSLGPALFDLSLYLMHLYCWFSAFLVSDLSYTNTQITL